MGFNSNNNQNLLSKIATNNGHGENSPYFDGWKAYDSNPYHPTQNPTGVIQMGLAENEGYDILNKSKNMNGSDYQNWASKWTRKPLQGGNEGGASRGGSQFVNNPKASIFTAEGANEFKGIAIYQDYHGLPEFRKGVAKFMGKVRGDRVTFDLDRIVMSGGATGAHEMLAFCLADPGEAFLVPTPYYRIGILPLRPLLHSLLVGAFGSTLRPSFDNPNRSYF
ncbi:unnamed protein product [Camellia sinensis]